MAIGAITSLAIRHQLKKYGYTHGRGFVPLRELRRAIVLFDVEDAEYDECRKMAEEFFSRSGIAFKPFYLDLGKHRKDDIILTDIKRTVLRRHLGFCGTLPKPIIEELISGPADLFICLAADSRPAVRCFCGIVPAKFCIGVCDYAGSPFNMVFSGGSADDNAKSAFHDSAKCFQSITEYLPKVV